jgi:hypothetical protein
MPVASGTRLRRVADMGLHRAHLAFAQVGSFNPLPGPHMTPHGSGPVRARRPLASYRSRPSWPAPTEECR